MSDDQWEKFFVYLFGVFIIVLLMLAATTELV